MRDYEIAAKRSDDINWDAVHKCLRKVRRQMDGGRGRPRPAAKRRAGE